MCVSCYYTLDLTCIEFRTTFVVIFPSAIVSKFVCCMLNLNIDRNLTINRTVILQNDHLLLLTQISSVRGSKEYEFYSLIQLMDRLCGLVVRVSGY
jgi:hypothetical protein